MINKKKENLGIGGGDLYDFLLLLQSYGEFVFWWQYVFGYCVLFVEFIWFRLIIQFSIGKLLQLILKLIVCIYFNLCEIYFMRLEIEIVQEYIEVMGLNKVSRYVVRVFGQMRFVRVVKSCNVMLNRSVN